MATMPVKLRIQDPLPMEEMFELLLDLHHCVAECEFSQDPLRAEGSNHPQLTCLLRQLAVAARVGGWCAYASVCLRVAERLQPLVEAGDLPQSTLRALTDWSCASLQYLTQPDNRKRAAAILPPVFDRNSHLGIAEKACLLRDLQNDADNHER
jgi:hypothetical protein